MPKLWYGRSKPVKIALRCGYPRINIFRSAALIGIRVCRRVLFPEPFLKSL
jgi:hypothetical protein